MDKKRIRALALALIQNSDSQYLLHQGFDKIKDETFYRPLGGGIDFYETGKEAVQREIMEELSEQVTVSELVCTFENLFTFEGKKGHEIILLYKAQFKKKATYKVDEFDIVERSGVVGKAVWRSLAQIKNEKAPLYPVGLEELLRKL